MPAPIWEMLVQLWVVFSFIASFLYHTAVIWLPPLLAGIFIKVWLNYVRTEYITNQGYFFVEIKLPREIKKTPIAMEIFLHGLWQKPPSTYIDTYWSGKVQPWFSLELTSIGGQVKFFMWGPKKYQTIAESQLYAQYPDTEIVPVEDYTNAVIHDLDKVFMWGSYFKLTNKDVYPIKTYVDYGLDRAEAKEETKSDPMTGLLEFLGSIRPTDQLWMQFLIQGHYQRKLAQGHLFPSKDWKDEAKREIESIKKAAGIGQPGVFKFLSKSDETRVEAIGRSVDKYAFDTIIRAMYISPAGNMDSGAIPALIGVFKQFSSNDFNGIKLGWFTDFDYPWMDFLRIRRTKAEKSMLMAYKMRSGFQQPYKDFHTKPFILTTEELATIYHFPGEVARTPTLSRIESKRSEAPYNLPV